MSTSSEETVTRRKQESAAEGDGRGGENEGGKSFLLVRLVPSLGPRPRMTDTLEFGHCVGETWDREIVFSPRLPRELRPATPPTGSLDVFSRVVDGPGSSSSGSS